MTADVRIGLEAHVYLRTQSKLFCRCSADFLASSRANGRVCVFCTGQPGAKPLPPNEVALVGALRLARALGATLEPRARFLRKHYFYPDLPSNYQRTSEPLARGGSLAGCGLWELHVEEDPGAYDAQTGLVDYDRSGAPLVEIVSAPELESPAHARRFLQDLRLTLEGLGIGRGEAGVKADCNVSVGGGARVEVKNVNSARNVERALAYEIERQRREGATRETRGFDEATGETRPLRAKETEADYRHLPDPDLAPLDLASLAERLPQEEPPIARRARLAALVGVTAEDASPLVAEPRLADLFERSPTRTRYQFLVRDLRAELDYRSTSLTASGVADRDIEALLAAREEERIPPPVATRLLRHALDGGDLQEALAAEIRQGGRVDALDEAVAATLAEHAKAVADYRAGKASAVQFLVGQAMRRLQGRADPQRLREKILQALEP